MIENFDKYGSIGDWFVGYFETFKEAETRVLNNVFDLNDGGVYKFARIEKLNPGLYQEDLAPTYYQFNKETRTYYKIECPYKEE